MPSLVDRTGQKYGRLLVLFRDASFPPATNGVRVHWVCRCECGAVVTRAGHELAAGDTQSCGCLKVDEIRKRPRNHGMRADPAYVSWRGAKDRCFDPAHDRYSSYGGRGITMCDQWRSDFRVFRADMGPRPAGTTLDRIDVNGDYEPGNCRWASASTQATNRRKPSHIWRGRGATIREIANDVGVPRTSLNKALVRFGDLDVAIAYALARRTADQ